MATSRAETGSSQTTSSGWVASARAMLMRWRWPPENWCGNRRCCSGRRPTSSNSSSTRAARSAGRAGVHQLERRAHRVAGALARVERGERVLEDDLQTLALAPQRLALERAELRGTEANRAGRDRREPHHGERGRRLARARLADDRQRRAALDAKHTPSTARTTSAVASQPARLRARSGPSGRARRAAARRRRSEASCMRRTRRRRSSQHAAVWPRSAPRISDARTACIGGTSAAQRAIACGQRSRKAQPLASCQSEGTTPSISVSGGRAPAPASSSARLLPSSGRHVDQALRVRVRPATRAPRPPCPARRRARRTSPARGRPSRRPRPCRA